VLLVVTAQRLAHALRQDLDAQLGAELLAYLRYDLLPARASGAEGGGLVTVELGNEGVEVLAGSGGLCYTGNHGDFSILRGSYR